ncbi:hypothetical protein ACP_1495 [Acidobacterium capsulatum ATCC 51196]|uniref:Uncharacterized protein n=1 Tax=Acidobacterium capsulatum (strain ATCC 51196 / DSM 11244 / BCRC 80197 / JCM 7670 / NBRC 15755 / NCIMB 13165 / 161) TaxID=240015 RepID=C1F6J4_ACIC5|nr:hypothetical protein ACP_1495 [Acidobacterium capsulatum ATCC 51196]
MGGQHGKRDSQECCRCQDHRKEDASLSPHWFKISATYMTLSGRIRAACVCEYREAICVHPMTLGPACRC